MQEKTQTQLRIEKEKRPITFWLSERDKDDFVHFAERFGGMSAVLVRLVLDFNEEQRRKESKRKD